MEGGHYADTFGGDGEYLVGVTFVDVCPEGVTLETTVVVDGCSAPDCGLELEVDINEDDSIIT